MPLAAVGPGGRVTVSWASRMAVSGNRKSETIPFFRFSRLSVRMTMGVTSLPVPAVVGMRILGSPRFSTRLMPMIWSRDLSLVIMTDTTLATSMAEPPPRPTIRSHLASRASSRHSWMVSRGGSGGTLLKTDTDSKVPSRTFRTLFKVPDLTMPSSVRMKTFLPPSSLISAGSVLIASMPMTILATDLKVLMVWFMGSPWAQTARYFFLMSSSARKVSTSAS